MLLELAGFKSALQRLGTFGRQCAQLTAFDLHGALLRVVRVQLEVHRAGQDQRQPESEQVKMVSRVRAMRVLVSMITRLPP